MVNNEAQRRYEHVVVAVDMSDASANAARIALSTGLINNLGGVTILHAFLAAGKGKLFVAGAAQASIDEYVAGERQTATDELVTFLSANDLSREGWPLRVEEGEPMEVISRTVSEMRSDLLVVGTRGRSALLKALIGSVTEQALRSLNVDILAVPLKR
jgi:nucleotide-binding universal stress UspA family protein